MLNEDEEMLNEDEEKSYFSPAKNASLKHDGYTLEGNNW